MKTAKIKINTNTIKTSNMPVKRLIDEIQKLEDEGYEIYFDD